MKNLASILCICFMFFSCHEDKDDNVLNSNVNFNFTHVWDGISVTNSEFNTIQFTNANGEQMSIEKLRYLISNITLTNTDNASFSLDGYYLIDVTNNQGLSFTPTASIPPGVYNLSFTFGFNNDDNYQNYPDLNAASWSVPEMLGGGYHYMQLEGKFIDNASAEVGYAYHAIRAVDNSGDELQFTDTFIEVDLGEITVSNNTAVTVEMNIAEWFKTPNTWDLIELNNMLMPNHDAQVMMYENGQNAFSLKSVE
ncbi:hypothetical protein PK35_12995 [Tamlana nanhaiensis]|uniref:Copper-binding protein MbnP-like domain-containing protein n=1 Tax=Neotamlana nanhaiensis TaxID=1382798 RepID=A0A0D7VZ02_9FLAO|nr:MbnP family protein [Tamlana nanhaiensis]KJD31673.1 hypothetical protein PK35_12995 [Tamlana nanhaiensis]